MRVKRYKDTAKIVVTGREVYEWLNAQQLNDSLVETLDATERMVDFEMEPDCRIEIGVRMVIEDPMRLSDADLDRKENGVPLV
jgi:hypothetical protein